MTIAQVGAFISFVPLLQILLPLKAAAIDPQHKALALSHIMFWGALAASASNLFAGAISDRTVSPLGRRRPFLLWGGAATILAYVMIYRARSVVGLMVGVVFFQVVFNFLFAALLALVVDRTPNGQRGLVSALLGLGYPMGVVGGAALVGGALHGEGQRFLALGGVVLISVAPFALFVRDTPIRPDQAPQGPMAVFSPRFWIDPRRHPDFALAWGGRFLVQVGFSLVQSYMLYYLQDVVRYPRLFPGQGAEQGLAVLTALAAAVNMVAALLGGLLSDRTGRRKGFVILGALIMAGATASFALHPGWSALLIAYGLHGLGTGIYTAVDIALVTQVLPSAKDAGKDLGIINLSNTAPQVIAPVLAMGLLTATHADFRGLFLIAAAVGAAGALMVAPIRAVR